MAKPFHENKETPNINFGIFQQELVGIVDEIKSHNSTSIFGKMGLFGGKKKIEVSHIDGSIIAQKFLDNKEVTRTVNELDKDPRNAMLRLKLVNTLMNASQDHELPDYKNLMLQAAIPVYLGDITPTILQVTIIVYQAYLTKLQNVHKQNMMAIRSTVLKNVNMGDIDVEEEAAGSGKKGKPAAAANTGVKSKEAVLTEIKVAEALLEKSRDVLANVKSKMSISLSHEEVEDVTVQGQAASSFFGGGSQGPSIQKQNMVIGKSVKAIEALKPLPILNSAGLNLARQIGRIDDKLSYPLVMEGRLHMQALRYQLLRIEAGDRNAREGMAPTFNQTVVAYRKAMKLVSKVSPKKADLPVLTEFANLTYYGFVHRDLMRLTVDGVKSLLKLGQGAVDAAVLINPQFTSLQGRLQNAKHQLDGDGGAVRAKMR